MTTTLTRHTTRLIIYSDNPPPADPVIIDPTGSPDLPLGLRPGTQWWECWFTNLTGDHPAMADITRWLHHNRFNFDVLALDTDGNGTITEHRNPHPTTRTRTIRHHEVILTNTEYTGLDTHHQIDTYFEPLPLT